MQGADILLVEDDEVLCDLVRRNLEVRGHQVQVAGDAASALLALRMGRFDLVFLDINLPDRTGWDVLRCALHEGTLHPLTLRERQLTLPVVVLSAVRVSPHRLAEFQPLAYLPKPFPIEALLRLAVEAAMRKDANEQAV